MRKIALSIFLFTFSSVLADEAFPNHTSVTFLFPHMATQQLAMEQSLWHHYTYHKQGSFLGALQVIPFFQKTNALQNREEHIPGYFLINCKNHLTVRGDDINGERDVRAEWLGLPSDFSGEMSVFPTQKQYGVTLAYHQNLRRFFEHEFLKYFWVSATMPITAAENNMHLQQEAVINPSPTTPHDIIQAFNQSSWDFAKINGECKRSGIAEVKLRLGSALYTKHRYEVDVWTLLSVPCSGKASPIYIFSPFIGNNRHFTMGTGVNFQFPFTKASARLPILFFFTIEHQWFIRNHQHRTFDLYGKQWSHYMLYNNKDGIHTNIPGVNILTRRVKVKPDSFVDLTTGLRIRKRGFEAEIGYDLWAHGRDRIEIESTFCQDCGEEIRLEDFGIAGSGPGKTASTSTIDQQGPDDVSFVSLNIEEVNPHSGAMQSTLSNEVHASIGYGYTARNFDCFVNIGGWYEHPMNNAAFVQWGVWGKLGATF